MGLFSRKKVAPPRVGLALGGGGARGFVEIGALKAFYECGFKFDVCVGTSVQTEDEAAPAPVEAAAE